MALICYDRQMKGFNAKPDIHVSILSIFQDKLRKLSHLWRFCTETQTLKGILTASNLFCFDW